MKYPRSHQLVYYGVRNTLSQHYWFLLQRNQHASLSSYGQRILWAEPPLVDFFKTNISSAVVDRGMAEFA